MLAEAAAAHRLRPASLVLGDLVGYGADPNAVVERVRELKPDARRFAATTTRSASGLESRRGFNAVARNAIRWTFEPLTDDNRDWLAALPAGPMSSTTCRDLPRHAVRRGRLRLRRARRAARACTRRGGRSACSATRTSGRLLPVAAISSALATADDAAAAARSRSTRPTVSRQSGVGGPAARRRSARRLRDRRHRSARDDDLPRGVSGREGAGADHARRGCPTCWRSDSALGR